MKFEVEAGASMANVIGAGCSESLPTTAAPTSQDRNPLNLENTSWTCWSWIQQPWTDTSIHSWAVLNILRPHCTTARACSVAALSLLVVILQGAMLHLLQHEAYFPACFAQASCPLGTACTYHPSGLRCTPCQGFAHDRGEILRLLGVDGDSVPSASCQDVINGSVVNLEIPALMSQRQTPTETDTTLLRHACDIQRRCLQSDRLEFRCDYIVYNLAAWRLGSKILLTVVALLAWAPMLRSMRTAATEEHMLSKLFDAADEVSLGICVAVFHLSLSLKARREVLVWIMVTTVVAVTASEPPVSANFLVATLGLSLFTSADRLWAQLLLGPAAYAELQGHIMSGHMPQLNLSEACRGLASIVLMLLLTFHLEDALRLGSPVVEYWGLGRGQDCDMVQGVLEFIVISAAAVLNALFTITATLATWANQECQAPLQSLLSNVLLSWISLLWLLGTSRLLVHFASGGGVIHMVPFLLFLFPGAVYPWWMAFRFAKRSGQTLDAACFTGLVNAFNRSKRGLYSSSASEYPALSFRM